MKKTFLQTKEDKRKFVKENMVFCDQVFKTYGIEGWKQFEPTRLIVQARAELKYSEKTYSRDIYRGLMETWEGIYAEEKSNA